MPRLWLSFVMLSAGLALMVTAQLAGAATERKGGIFRFGTIGASVEVDPQVAYISTSWWTQYATAAKLYNYRPGGKLVPEVASRFTVSNNGKRYTFFIRKGFRFSDGVRVTALHFEFAINRAATKDLDSPAAQFIIDPNGTEIVGAKDVNEGRASRVRGVRVRGNRLIIDLVRANPAFLSTTSMPFFQATSTRLPLDREVREVRRSFDLPAAGPYAFTVNEVNRVTQLRRNPYWKPGPGRPAARNLAGVDILWNLNGQAAFEMVERGELDEGPVPAAHVQDVVNLFGVNRTRFWSIPGNCTGWVLFNNRGDLFRNNVSLRKAINWALDRRAWAELSFTPYSASPWTHLLPPSFPGSISRAELQPYQPGPDLEKARALAAGHFRDGRITVVFPGNRFWAPKAELVRRDLTLLGFDAGNIELRSYYFPPLHWDLAVVGGWCGDYPDPLTFFTPLDAPEGTFAFPAPSLDDPRYARKIAEAARLRGKARLKAFGELDLDLMRNLAPVAPMQTYNVHFFFSDRVDPRSLSFHRIYTGWSIPALALK